LLSKSLGHKVHLVTKVNFFKIIILLEFES
jgi:hypothetical protein